LVSGVSIEDGIRSLTVLVSSAMYMFYLLFLNASCVDFRDLVRKEQALLNQYWLKEQERGLGLEVRVSRRKQIHGLRHFLGTVIGL